MKFSVKKIFKWLLYLFIFVLLLITGIFLTLQYFFPSAFLISKIEAYMKDNYNLGLKIEKLDFSILNGITVKEFSFNDNDIPDSLFTLNSFTLKYNLRPLLNRKIVVEKIIVDQPVINVVKYRDGRFNFDGIIDKFAGEDKAKEEPQKETEKETAEDGEKAFDFVVDLKNFEVNGIDVKFEDRSEDNPMTVQLPKYSLSVRDVNFKDMDNVKADILFSTDSSNELIFRDKANSLRFRQDMKVSVNVVNENVSLNFDHKINGLKLFSDFANLEDIGDINISFRADYNLKKDELDLNSFQFSFADMVRASLNAEVTGLTSSPEAELGIKEIYADVAELANFAGSRGLADLMGAGIKDSQFSINEMKIKYSDPDSLISADGSWKFSAGNLTYGMDDIYTEVNGFTASGELSAALSDMVLTESAVSLDASIDRVDATVGDKDYFIGGQKISIRPVLNSDFMPGSVRMTYEIGDLTQGTVSVELDASFDLSDMSVPALIKNTKADISFRAERLHPNEIEETVPQYLFVTIHNDLTFEKGIAENTFSLYSEYEKAEDPMLTPLNDLKISNYLKADISGHPDEKYRLLELTAKVSDFLSAEIKDLSADLKTMDISVAKLDAEIDLDRLLETGKLTGLEAIQNTRLYNGLVNVTAAATGNMNDAKADSKVNFSMTLDSLFHDEIAITRGLRITQTADLASMNVLLQGDVEVNGADFDGMLSEMHIDGNVKVKNRISYTESGEVRIHELSASVPSVQAEFSLTGTADVSDSLYPFDITAKHNLKLLDNYSFVEGIGDIKGSVSGKTLIKGNMKEAVAQHTQSLSDIGLVLELDTLGNKVSIINLNAEIPFNAKLDLESLSLLPYNKYDKIQDYEFLNYNSMRDQYRINGLPVSNFRIDTIAVSHELFTDNIRNIDLDIYFDNNKFCLNRFYYELFDGNTAGFMRLDLGKGDFDGIIERSQLDMALNMTGLNTYYLTRAQTGRSPSTEMNVIFKLRSKGLDFIEKPDLNGEINISKISGDDAKYLLEFLNKNTGDQTAGMVRNILNAFPGIKVELFSFTIKNNFLYTLIRLKKPWYLVYFPLAEQISLSKQSIKFYLDKYVREDF